MHRNHHILTVEDDEPTRELIHDYLSEHGFRTSAASDGREMDQRLAADAVDLIVMDLNLPGDSGLDLTRRLRRDSDVPVIMLTGQNDEVDRILGLELGADDYLTKPFSPRELMARIRAVLRRFGRRAASSKSSAHEKGRTYRFADWELDPNLRHLRATDGRTAKLTNSEYNLLVVFLGAPQRIWSRDQLLELSRVRGDEVFDRSIDTLILRLRRKLESNPREPCLIRTERGAGYFFASSVTAL